MLCFTSKNTHFHFSWHKSKIIIFMSFLRFPYLFHPSHSLVSSSCTLSGTIQCCCCLPMCHEFYITVVCRNLHKIWILIFYFRLYMDKFFIIFYFSCYIKKAKDKQLKIVEIENFARCQGNKLFSSWILLSLFGFGSIYGFYIISNCWICQKFIIKNTGKPMKWIIYFLPVLYKEYFWTKIYIISSINNNTTQFYV